MVAAALMLAAVSVVFAAFFQDFQTDTSGWFSTTRVASGTHLVPSESGTFHAEDGGGAFTRWGGYSETFPVGGYTTTVDIYLDIAPPYGSALNLTPYPNDTRFDWSSAINTPQCVHRRDFVFNAGFYTDTDTTGTGPRFVISASNNAGRGSSFPKNPGRDPFTISVEGWYTFEHRFYGLPPAPGGQLFVDLTIKDAVTGAPLHTWTLTDPSDVIGTSVGGNRYGWFVTDEFPFLAFDTSALIGFQDFCVVPPSPAGTKVTAGGWITTLTGDKGTFGLTAKANATGAPSGNLTYQDHSLLGRTVKSTAVTSVTPTSDNCVQILGMATVNGTPGVGFDVDVCDNLEPGKDADTFSIVMSDGYTAMGTLAGGNVQIHK
ncbi:MAG TPA: post-COAP-1 domain-containing protein [Vicinamibacterales bacterium]|nr:post-COAP-1 domain-containing protein [Vicinamibacterales bacterium]